SKADTEGPRSPWQRGSNENTNRLLRQYLAKNADLYRFTQDELDQIANKINTRPRQVLDWLSSRERLRACRLA
ncbi:IS30 family transposase, partial [Brachybacterium alimentarium]|uniref:IS30 family transposase n=1 Tax=Brachybacterium alimentarium TaxID=47845 RepID=UPI000E07B432